MQVKYIEIFCRFVIKKLKIIIMINKHSSLYPNVHMYINIYKFVCALRIRIRGEQIYLEK